MAGGGLIAGLERSPKDPGVFHVCACVLCRHLSRVSRQLASCLTCRYLRYFHHLDIGQLSEGRLFVRQRPVLIDHGVDGIRRVVVVSPTLAKL